MLRGDVDFLVLDGKKLPTVVLKVNYLGMKVFYNGLRGRLNLKEDGNPHLN